MSTRQAAALVLALVGATGCAADGPTTSTEERVRVDVSSIITPMCQLGCVDPDPSPNSPGIFLGNDLTATFCTGDALTSTDADADQMSDYCEKVMAQAFAPELYWAYGYDDVRREPYWAARNLGGGRVRIAYLPAYYYDLGSSAGVCVVPGAHYTCLPHNGDSEAIGMDLKYNSSTKHWVLERILLSQHGAIENTGPSASGYPSLTYPVRAGGYPRIWIAEDKHANYRSAALCNSGGTFGSDTCSRNNRGDRLEVAAIYNIGSRSTPLIDCVVSRNPSYEFYGAGRSECFWTTKEFRGWVPDNVGGGQAGVYSTVLGQLNF